MSSGLKDVGLGTKSKLKEKISKFFQKNKNILIITIIFLSILIFLAGLAQINGINVGNYSLDINSINGSDDDKIVGSEVIEVIVMDSNISNTLIQQNEPDVTVNDKKLRMVQGVDGNWYGYFADRDMAQIADSIATGNTPGKGQDYGYFCNSDLGIAIPDIDEWTNVSFTDTVGVIIDEIIGGAVDGSSIGGEITAICGSYINGTDSNYNNIIKNPRQLNNNTEVLIGQIGLIENLWPLIQLYDLTPDGNVVIQYNRTGSPLAVNLTFVTVDEREEVKKYELRLKSGSFIPVEGFQIDEIIASTNSTETENFFFLQTTRFLDTSEIESLKNNGITLLDYLDGFVYLASANDSSIINFSFNSPEFRSAVPIYGKYKLDPVLECIDRPDILDTKFIGNPFHIPIKSDSPLIVDGGNATAIPRGNTFEIPGEITSEIPGEITSEIPGEITSEIPVTVFYHDQRSEGEMTQIIHDHGVTENGTIEAIKAVEARMTCEKIINLSKFSAIEFITRQDPPLEPEISEAKNAAHITEINNIPNTNLTGNGTVALVYDETKISNHPDFEDRVREVDSGSTGYSSHSVHVAGIIGANGPNPGIAPEIEIWSWGNFNSSSPWTVMDDFTSDTVDLKTAFETANKISIENKKGIDLMNISMGHHVNENGDKCATLGDYTSTSKLLDEFVKGGIDSDDNGILDIIYQPTTITKSAGNERNPDGGSKCESGNNPEEEPDGQYGTINSPATAKNPIVVGAVHSDDVNTIYSKSGFGPTDDGRIKPDLVAPGTHTTTKGINSTSVKVDNGIVIPSYEAKEGTSMSSAFVGGLVALIDEQWFHMKTSINPENHLLPHTVKAILIHTADDLDPLGPDFENGWGLVNGEKAIRLVAESKFVNATRPGVNKDIDEFPTIIYDSVANHDYKEYLINIDKLKSLNVTLVWDDPTTRLILTGKKPVLKNDLDLEVNEGGKPKFYPFLLKIENGNPTLKNGTDDLNNVEMIRIDDIKNNPKISVKINATQFEFPYPSEIQDYTLIVSGTFEKEGEPPVPPPLETKLEIKESGDSSDSIKIIGNTTSDNIINVKVESPEGEKFEIKSFNPTLSNDDPPQFEHEIFIADEKWKQNGTYRIIFDQTGEDGTLNEDSIEVEIIDGVVIPEFGTIAVMILAVAIISIIITTKSKLRIIQRN